MKLPTRPFFKYPGSKWLLSKHYPKPKHDVIVEPFAGSACYSVQNADRQVILHEVNPDIYDLWVYLISGPADEIVSLPASSLERGFDIRDLGCSLGAKLLIRHWQRVGTSTCWTVSSWNNKPGQWSDRTRDAVADQVECIKHWKINSSPALSASDVEATWFIDPPYQSLKLFGSKNIDYAELGQWCKERKGQVIVCERSGAAWLPFEEFRSVPKGRRKHGQASEAVYLQG